MNLTWRRKLHETQLPVNWSVALTANDITDDHRIVLRMAQLDRIHAEKQPRRIHFIEEWAKKRGMKQVDLAREIGTDKSTVSRWFKGSLPTEPHLVALAGLLEIEVTALFTHPDDEWLAKFFRDRTEDERKRAMQVLELAFPRTGPCC